MLTRKEIKSLREEVERIKKAVGRVTGLSFEEYSTKSRKRECVFARMLFAHSCKSKGMNEHHIAAILRRDRTTILYALNAYENEIKFNRFFWLMAERVDRKINKNHG